MKKDIYFLLYIIILFKIVTFKSIKYSNNFIPFNEILRYPIYHQLFYKNVIGNIILFIPFGFYLAFYLNKTWKVLILSMFFSLFIEINQILIGRVFDIDDIILNTSGALLGFKFIKCYLKI